jgi:hypothetical protein
VPSTAPSFDPSARPSDFNPTPGPTGQPAAPLPAKYLLRQADLVGGFTGTGDPFAGQYSANPLAICGQRGLPGPAPTGAIAEMLTQGDGNSAMLGGETVLSYGTVADAHAVLDGIRQKLPGEGADACGPHFTEFLNGSAGGDESVVFYSREPAVVLPQAAHGTGIIQAIVRRGGYLIWITVVTQSGSTDPTELSMALVQRASTRLCSQASC